MTREEAKAELTNLKKEEEYSLYYLTHQLLDDIYDDFESRTCENCKFLNRDTGKSYSTCTELPLNMGADTITEFGCNWFKRKDNELMG